MKRSKAPSQSKYWPLHVVLIAFGLATIFSGIVGLTDEHWWVASFNARLGRVGKAPTLGYIALGSIFLVIGVLPWKRISDWLEKRNLRNRK
jgi:hypothetical protein